MNLIDSAISVFSPERALQRARARVALRQLTKFAFDGADSGRRTDGWKRSSASANSENRVANAKLRNAARDLVRNNPLARKGLYELQMKTVGTGIRPQAKTGRTEWDTRLDDAFVQWSRKCNWEGRPGFFGTQSLAARAIFESGEVLIRKRFVKNPKKGEIPLRIQVLEPDFLDSNKLWELKDGSSIIDGIQFDEDGQRMGYWLFNQHPGEALGTVFTFKENRLSNFIPADDVVHGFVVERPGQQRGVTWFYSVIATLNDLAGYADAERVRKRVEACLAAFVTTSDDGQGTLGAATTDSNGQRVESFEPGMVAYLKGNAQVTLSEPKSSGDYESYVRSEQHMVAAGLVLLYAVLTGDLSTINYSSYRGGALGLKALIEFLQWEYLIPCVGDTVWEWFVDACKIQGIVPDTCPYGVEWSPPAFDLLDRAAEADADNKMMRNGTMTLFQAISRQGYDPKKQLAEIAEANKLIDSLKLVLDSDPRKVNQSGAQQGTEKTGGQPNGGKTT